jgi:Flp pilus assembly protein TadG
MRRLMSSLVQRTANDDGSVAVMVAVFLVVLLGAAAFTVDFSTMHLQRRQHQNSADAGALAIAQDCARRNCPADEDARAAEYTGANEAVNSTPGNFGTSTSDANLNSAGGTVTVTVTGANEPILRGVINQPENDISASATAVWGTPTSLNALLPITFSACEYDWLVQQTVGDPDNLPKPPEPWPDPSVEAVFRLKSSNWESEGFPCERGPGSLVEPGSWGWLESNVAPCGTLTEVGERAPTSTGIAPVCRNLWPEFLGRVVYLPIYSAVCRNQTGPCDPSAAGANTYYEIDGYVGFFLTGYGFPGLTQSSIFPGSTKACGGGLGANPCIIGYFVSGLIPANQVPPGAIVPGDMSGAAAVQLID